MQLFTLIGNLEEVKYTKLSKSTRRRKLNEKLGVGNIRYSFVSDRSGGGVNVEGLMKLLKVEFTVTESALLKRFYRSGVGKVSGVGRGRLMRVIGEGIDMSFEEYCRKEGLIGEHEVVLWQSSKSKAQ